MENVGSISNTQRRREGSGVDLEAVAFDALVEMFDVETEYVSNMAKRGSALQERILNGEGVGYKREGGAS